MSNPTSARGYTVVDAIDSMMGASAIGLRHALEAIGLDPDMPVDRLRALVAERDTAPVPEPTCTTCGGIGFIEFNTDDGWHNPCPVCAVPNPESSPQ